MKSGEYYEKYFKAETSLVNIEDKARAMLRDFMQEFDEIKNKREVKTVDGIVGIVRELNEKWNAVANKVERQFSTQILNRNVIWNALLAGEAGYPRKPD